MKFFVPTASNNNNNGNGNGNGNNQNDTTPPNTPQLLAVDEVDNFPFTLPLILS